MKQFVSVCLLLFSTISFSNEKQIEIATGELHLGLAMGVGTITNPLQGGDNFPLIVIPDIAYYGESVYFDNGQLGYTLFANTRHSVSIASEMNPENRFYVSWHPANILSPINANKQMTNTTRIDIGQINKPKWAVDGGINYQYFGDTWRLSASVFTDISNVHKGERASVSVVKGMSVLTGTLSLGTGFDYLSTQTADYYYGIQKEDNVGVIFNQKAAILPFLEVNWHSPINRDFGFLAKLKYYYYGELSDSPLFSSNESLTVFAGVTHVF